MPWAEPCLIDLRSSMFYDGIFLALLENNFFSKVSEHYLTPNNPGMYLMQVIECWDHITHIIAVTKSQTEYYKRLHTGLSVFVFDNCWCSLN